MGGRRVFQLAYKFTHNRMKSAQEKDLNSCPAATPPGFCKMKKVICYRARATLPFLVSIFSRSSTDTRFYSFVNREL